MGESRADVEMRNEEDEEKSEAEILRVTMNPKNPTSREKQEHEDSVNFWKKRREKGGPQSKLSITVF